ncbi:hypothetical protein BDM02DRAFT_3132132 [Thelephora ganbajun]|uniref:Uncharacterized protein n=1 Tax=Thelephora ganbajun TaxID=370292 RepID=A0ACB6Z2W0_THEGA|nr:hypothetical protein BDM02DRAFT_3132132 [Thelephora ganbajun]
MSSNPPPHSMAFPDASFVYGHGDGYMGMFYNDTHANERTSNLYFPFQSKGEWEIASFLSCLGLSMKRIDEFLSLSLISGLGLSFHCARTLCGCIELLPSGPSWKSTVVSLPGYPTKNPLMLYYCDPLDCIQFILKNPLFSGQIQYVPRLEYNSNRKQRYNEWITSDGAWDMQARLPQGATLLGVVLSSDKTGLTSMTGDHTAHPLLITLANINSAVHLSSSSHTLKLLALIPVPKFVGIKKKLHGILENRLLHMCLDFVTSPLKTAAQNGTWMSDYTGYICQCFTPLAAYVADTPEATALAGVAGKTSHLTMASFKEFVYVTNAQTLFHLNGIHLPFWCDWKLPDGTLPNPSQLFPIEILHHLHKAFWDHDVKWIMQAIGDHELDLWFSLLQPQTSYCHFSSGISALKQVTGHEHWDIQ